MHPADTPIRPPYKPQGIGGMVQGAAPEAKVIGIGNIYRSWSAISNAMLLSALLVATISFQDETPGVFEHAAFCFRF